MPYEVILSNSAEKAFRKLNGEMAERVGQRLDDLAKDPEDCAEGKCRRTHSLKTRVGSVRILYDVYENAGEVHVTAIAGRGEAYTKKHTK